MQFDFNQQPGLKKWNRSLVKNEKPLVSIITPYYNGGKYIQQTCNCILDQTFPYFEWIIVDDGSTKAEDIEMLNVIARQDPRIKIYNKENGGPAEARNYGVSKATAEYVFTLDSDDLIEPTYIEYCWWMLEKNEKASWAYSDSLGFGTEEYLWKPPYDPNVMKKENVASVTALIRKKAFNSVNGYDSHVAGKHYNEDWHFWLRLIADGHFPVQSKGEYLFWYRRSNTGELSVARSDTEIQKLNRKVIADAAANIKSPAQGIIFPQKFTYNWTAPVLSNWDKCIYENKEKKNILFVVPWLELGGADKFNLDLISGLDKTQYEVGVITTVSCEHPWQQRFREATPDVFNLPHFMAAEDYAEFISYYIKSRKVDVLFLSNSYHGYYLLPWLRENFPDMVIVDYVHSDTWYWRNGGYARTSAAMTGIIEKTYTCNTALEKVFTNKLSVPENKVQTVYIGVDEQYFKKGVAPKGILYKEAGISEERPVILFVGRFHPDKRPFLILEVAERVRSKIHNIAFAFIGNGPQEDELKAKVHKMNMDNNVYFLGAKKDVRPYYEDAKATILCSMKEGLALTAYESCSMGVPIISADVGGQYDLIDDSVGALVPMLQNEETDYDSRTFPEEEINGYVDAIVKLLADDDLWQKTSVNCRKRVEETFTIEYMVEFYNKEFQYLVNDKEMAEKRHKISNALKLCSPMAADYCTMEMQQYSTEMNNVVYVGSGNYDHGVDDLYLDGYFVKFYRIINKLFPKGGKMREYIKKIAGFF